MYINSSYGGCIRSRCSGLKGLRGELRKTINTLRISSLLLTASAYRAVNYTVSMVIFWFFSNFGTSSFIACIIILKNIIIILNVYRVAARYLPFQFCFNFNERNLLFHLHFQKVLGPAETSKRAIDLNFVSSVIL